MNYGADSLPNMPKRMVSFEGSDLFPSVDVCENRHGGSPESVDPFLVATD